MHGAHVLRTVFHGRAGVRRGGARVLAGADLSRETISFSGERPMALEVQALTGRRFAAPIDFAAHIQRAARDLVRVAVGLGRNPIPEDLCVNGGGNMYRGGGAKMYHGLGGSLSA